ncbi:hypothetical protein [Dyella solisilvae]|uniref:hypothetical protein n=1 Tax=Dyella solisilvae TaxID=1920168 RepID=UPI0011C01EFE|nr:hypothetical protein [Dyella solisilvae]
MSKTIIVSLGTNSAGLKYLVINDGDKANEFDRGKHTVMWELDKDLNDASFNPQNDLLAPGFSWIGGTPNEGIFGGPIVSGNAQGTRRVMKMANNNANPNTIGVWYYRLSATIQGVLYLSQYQGTTNPTVAVPAASTEPVDGGKLLSMMTGNPSIKNN